MGALVHCRGCGKEIHETAPMCPHCGYVQQAAGQTAGQQGGQPGGQNTSAAPQAMTFGNAIKTCLSKYATFEGRASRSEYWYFWLFSVLLGFFAAFTIGPQVQGVVSLALLLPSLAAASRRLHDSDHSGWHQLWGLTIIGGLFPLLYWLVQPSQTQANRFGPPPSE